MNVNLQIIPALENVFTQKTSRLGFCQRCLENLPAFRKFTSDIQVGQFYPVGEAAQDHSLNQLMGILVDNLPVFESSGLGFIRITDQIDGLGHLRGIDKTPLCPRRETRTSSST